VGDLDLDGLPLVAGLVLPTALDELAGHEDPHAFLKRPARVLGDRSPCRAAEEPVVDVLPLPVVLAAVADRDGEVREGRATLGIAKLGLVGEVPTKATWFITTSLPGRSWLARSRSDATESSPRHRRNATDAKGKRALMSAQRAVAWRSSGLRLRYKKRSVPAWSRSWEEA
jgi:hypothetical protein